MISFFSALAIIFSSLIALIVAWGLVDEGIEDLGDVFMYCITFYVCGFSILHALMQLWP